MFGLHERTLTYPFVFVVWLFLAVPWVCLQFVIVVCPDLTHLLLLGFRYQIIVSSITFRKGFEKFMILIALSSTITAKSN